MGCDVYLREASGEKLRFGSVFSVETSRILHHLFTLEEAEFLQCGFTECTLETERSATRGEPATVKEVKISIGLTEAACMSGSLLTHGSLMEGGAKQAHGGELAAVIQAIMEQVGLGCKAQFRHLSFRVLVTTP